MKAGMRETIILAVLMVGILGAGAALFFISPKFPKSIVDKSRNTSATDATTKTLASADRYPQLGEKGLFNTLIPTPTPKPTPPPTPKPMPAIKTMMASWKLAGLTKDTIEIQQGTEYFEMKKGEEHEIDNGKAQLTVRLVEVDSNNYKATFKAQMHEKDEEWEQEHTLIF